MFDIIMKSYFCLYDIMKILLSFLVNVLVSGRNC